MSNIKSSILIVEDESYIKKVLETALAAGGYRTISAVTGAQARSAISSYMPDMVLLDLGLPDMDGVKLLKELRQWSAMPVIVVSARSTERDKILALDNGADDYITKPFSFNLLIRRVKAVLRRGRINISSDLLIFEKLKLDLNTYSVQIDDQNIELTLKEFNILKMLIEKYPQVVTRENLLDSIWGYDYYGDTRIVDAHIKNLRKKIILPYIKTVKGIGYTLEKDIEVLE